MQSVRIVRCPRCGTRTEYLPADKWRPFCSERCRTIDLGRWAAEEYRFPEKDDSSSKPPES
ncbi:MAG TPA: DNA gyrase inhibitor YacG [Burkholderiales bacterium]|nr:DNA gyrase inhibitor YacG [Burkholderiales bacterium]